MPAAGYELRTIRVAGLDRRNPLRAARAALLAAAAVVTLRAAAARAESRRGDGRRRLRGGAGRARRGAAADPARADGGRLATWGSPTACSRRSRGASASPSRSPAATGARYRVTGRPGAAARDRPSPPRARASGSAADDTVVLVFGGSLGARSINEAAVEAFARRAVPRPARRRRARLRRARRARPALRPARVHPRASATRCSPPTSSSPAPAARCSRSPPHGRPAILIPYPARRRRPPDRQRALDGATAARPSSIPDAELTATRLAHEVGDAARTTAPASPRWRHASAALARPDAARDDRRPSCSRRPAAVTASTADGRTRSAAARGPGVTGERPGPGGGCTSSGSGALG